MKKILLTTLLLLAVTMAGFAQKMKNVTVTNADEFIKAIASNTNINIKSKDVIDLIPALNKLDDSRNYRQYDETSSMAPGAYYACSDRELVIVNINNLTINGESAETTHIQSASSYTYVLKFVKCNNITVRNIMAGHTERGECSADVICLDDCQNVKIEKCDLYGCGYNGISMWGSKDITVNNTEIRDCSSCMAYIWDSQNVVFNDCYMHNCYSTFDGNSENEIHLNNCNIVENGYDYDYEGEYYGDEGEYGYEGTCPQDLMEAMNAAGKEFRKKLNNSEVVDGVIYEILGEEEGHVVIPEMDGWYAAYIPQPLGDGEYEFFFLDNVNTKAGEKMFFGNGHIIVIKKEGVFSYQINENKLKSVTSITGSGNNMKYSHGKDKNSLKKCTKAEAEPHFEFDATDVEKAVNFDEVYPWG